MVIAVALRNVTPLPSLLGWVVLVTVVTTIARYLLFKAYFARPRQAEEAPLWANRFSVAALVMGCMWGLLGSVLCRTGRDHVPSSDRVPDRGHGSERNHWC